MKSDLTISVAIDAEENTGLCQMQKQTIMNGMRPKLLGEIGKKRHENNSLQPKGHEYSHDYQSPRKAPLKIYNIKPRAAVTNLDMHKLGSNDEFINFEEWNADPPQQNGTSIRLRRTTQTSRSTKTLKYNISRAEKITPSPGEGSEKSTSADNISERTLARKIVLKDHPTERDIKDISALSRKHILSFGRQISILQNNKHHNPTSYSNLAAYFHPGSSHLLVNTITNHLKMQETLGVISSCNSDSEREIKVGGNLRPEDTVEGIDSNIDYKKLLMQDKPFMQYMMNERLKKEQDSSNSPSTNTSRRMNNARATISPISSAAHWRKQAIESESPKSKAGAPIRYANTKIY